MSDLAEEEVRVLQLLEKERSLSAMGFPEELRGAVTRLVERGLVWRLDTRGMVHFRASTEGAARLRYHYETAIREFEQNKERPVPDEKPTCTVEIYMRSGNVVVLDRVVHFDVTYTSGKMARLSTQQMPDATCTLVVQSLDFSQIEAITRKTEDRL